MVKKTICLDFGNTGIKTIDGSKEEQLIEWNLIEPEYLALPNSSSKTLPQDAAYGKQIDNAWIKFKEKGDCHLIGITAKEYYQAELDLIEPKINSIVPKTLGTVASIYLEKPFSDYRLGLLVPLNELGGAAELKANLVKSLKSFYFRSQKISIPIAPSEIFIVPEGAGAAMRDQQNRSDTYTYQAYLMVGYNHATFSVFKNARFIKHLSKIERLGFIRLFEFMQQRYPGLEKDTLLRAIHTTVEDFNLGHATPDWSKITQDLKKIQLLQQVFSESLEEYWRMLKKWLDGCINSCSIECLIRLGGTTDLINKQLSNYFRDFKIDYFPANDYKSVMLKAFGYNSPYDRAAEKFIKYGPIRWADVWGLFAALSSYSGSVFAKNNSALIKT